MSTNQQVSGDTVPPCRITTVPTVEGFPENLWNPRNSGAWQLSSARQMRDFSLNLHSRAVRVWKARPVLSEPGMEPTKSFDLLEVEIRTAGSGLSYESARDPRRKALLLSLVPAILHKGIGDWFELAIRGEQKRYPPVVEIVR